MSSLALLIHHFYLPIGAVISARVGEFNPGEGSNWGQRGGRDLGPMPPQTAAVEPFCWKVLLVGFVAVGAQYPIVRFASMKT